MDALRLHHRLPYDIRAGEQIVGSEKALRRLQASFTLTKLSLFFSPSFSLSNQFINVSILRKSNLP